MNDSTKAYRALLPILVGGLVAGALDLTSAFYFYGRGVPRVIAAGLLGRGVIGGQRSGNLRARHPAAFLYRPLRCSGILFREPQAGIYDDDTGL